MNGTFRSIEPIDADVWRRAFGLPPVEPPTDDPREMYWALLEFDIATVFMRRTYGVC